MALKDLLTKLVAREDLTSGEAAGAMGEIMDGAATPAQIAAFATALRIKGESVAEIVGCARAMRERMVRVQGGEGVILDTCGTGGDGRGTFNVSTIAAFVVAACGVRVAKHGNRAASSKCGSADLLEALGVRIELPAERVGRILQNVGIAYLHAPSFHPAMRHAAPVRKELGFRTIFNILGPLCNPASANVQIIGLFRPELSRPLCEVLRALGCRAALVFHGHGGLDELSTTGANEMFELRSGRISRRTIGPVAVGVRRSTLSHLLGGTPQDNAQIAVDILAGKKGPARDIVVLNAAMALVTAGRVGKPKDGGEMATHALYTGAARRKLDEFIKATR